MATFLNGGTATFDAMIYGDQHQGTTELLRQQFSNVGHHLSDAARRFMDSAQAQFEQLSQGYAAQLLRAAGRAINSFWIPDQIQILNSIGQIQYAPHQMRRWIMAEESLRKLYHQGRVEGYGEDYIDLDPGKVGAAHYDYRRATNGLVQIDQEPDDDGNYGFQAITYFEALRADDRELELVEQADIQATWKALRPMLTSGSEDPTSKYGADIG